jgi:hypothetical protein
VGGVIGVYLNGEGRGNGDDGNDNDDDDDDDDDEGCESVKHEAPS